MKKELVMFYILMSTMSESELLELFKSINELESFNEKANNYFERFNKEDTVKEVMEYLINIKKELTFFLDNQN